MTNEIRTAAYNVLSQRHPSAIFAPASDATVVHPDFNPCRAVQPIAIVAWPATLNMQDVTLSHCIMDGDAAALVFDGDDEDELGDDQYDHNGELIEPEIF